MDNSGSFQQRKECVEKDISFKEAESCGPLYRGGECNFTSCIFTGDHYHCQGCGNASSELSQALLHIRTSPACRRDISQPQYQACSGAISTDTANSLYNAIYNGLAVQNAFSSAGFGSYGQMESFQWHPTVPVDKVSICNTQLSPCCGTSSGARVPIDSQLCSPISELYSKVTTPGKDISSLPSKSGGAPMDSQAWFAAYNSQQMQKSVYKYPDQNSLPQMNFLLLDPSDQKHSEMSLLATDSSIPVSSAYGKTDFNSRDVLKDSFCAYGPQSMHGVLSEDASSLFNSTISEDTLKQADMYHSIQQSLIPHSIHEDPNLSTDKKLSKTESTSSSRLLSRFTQDHYGNCLSSCSMFPPLMIAGKDSGQCDENSNQTSSSISESDESDIIVEDTGDELGAEITESEIFIEDIKCSLLQGVVTEEENQNNIRSRQIAYSSRKGKNLEKIKDAEERDIEVVKGPDSVPLHSNRSCRENVQIHCVICDIVVSEETPGSFFLEISNELPITTNSHVPVLSKLTQVVARELADFLDVYRNFICRRCFSLVDIIDSLEAKLELAKQDLISIFKNTSKSIVMCGTKLVVDMIEPAEPALVEIPLSKTTKELKSSLNVTASVQTVESLLQGQSSLVDACCNTQEISGSTRNNSNLKTSDLESIVERDTFLAMASADERPHPVNLNSTEPISECVKDCEQKENSPQCSLNTERKLQNVDLKQELMSQSKAQEEFHCNSRNNTDTQSNKQQPVTNFSSDEIINETGNCIQENSEHAMTESKNLLCEICGKSFESKLKLEKHTSWHRNCMKFNCHICDKNFASATLLTIHIRTHTGERPYACSQCGRAFAHRSNLTAHEKICSGSRPFACSKCDQLFALRVYLDRHVKIAHDGSSLQMQCKDCGKGFNKPSDLRIHQRVHSTNKAFECKVCGRCYKSIGNLNHHSKSHATEKPYMCNVCNQGFLRKENFEAHTNTHKGEKPFLCTKCPKAFWSKEYLAAHVKWHDGTLKKNTCTICNKTFSQKLSVHMRTHTGARPFKCEICNHGFSTKSSLKKHCISKHNFSTTKSTASPSDLKS